MSTPRDAIKRTRLTPAEAEKLRSLKRQQEAAERKRRRQESIQIAREVQKRLIEQAPITNEDRSDLDNIAFNVHAAYDWNGRDDQCVTAVILKTNGHYVAFCQRYMRAMEDYARAHYAAMNIKFKPGCSVHHLHAEMYAIYNYLIKGQIPSEHIARIGVSKPICPDCQNMLNHFGIVYTLRWITSQSSPHWVNPENIIE